MSSHLTAECTISKSRAVCNRSVGGPDANFPGVETTTAKVQYFPVTVTVGSVTSAGHMTTLTGTVGASSTPTSSETDSATASEESSSGAVASQTGDADEPTETGAANRVMGMSMSAFGVVGVVVIGLVEQVPGQHTGVVRVTSKYVC